MPACFQLYDKSKSSEGPVVLDKIDDEMCAHFGVSPDPIKYLNRWVDSIGFRLAIGKTFAQIREEFEKNIAEEKQRKDEGYAKFYQDSLLILAYLEERYTVNSFHSPFKD